MLRPVLALDNYFSLASDRARAEFLISLAHLAPSSHNTQPWLFRIDGHVIEVWGNPKRELSYSDPDRREFFISIGCAIQNLLAAFDYYHLPFQISFFPEPQSDPLFAARIEIKDFISTRLSDKSRHPADSIIGRHTNRYNYDDAPLPKTISEYIENIKTQDQNIEIVVVQEKKKIDEISEIVIAATVAAFQDKRFCQELANWMHPSLKKYRDGLVGYNIDIPWPISFLVPFLMRHTDPSAMQRKMIQEALLHTPAFLVISSKSEDPLVWTKIGMIYEDIALRCAMENINNGPYGAPIEIGEFYRQLQAAIGSSCRPQFFARLGHAKKTPQFSPRIELEKIMIEKSF